MAEETLPGGRVVERDPDTGQFKKTKLPPETAAEMGRKSGSPNTKAQQLLAEEGYNDTDNPAPQYIVLMAEQSTKSHAALNHWRRYHQRVSGAEVGQEHAQVLDLQPNELCPHCGRLDPNWKMEQLTQVLMEIDD
jgi:hypothetical protein